MIPWRREWQLTPVFLPGESHGQRDKVPLWAKVHGVAKCQIWLSNTLKLSGSYSLQFISVTQSCPTLCDPMNHSTPGLPVHHQLLDSTQTHRWLSRWCHPTISSFVVPFSCLQSSPESRSFPMSQLIASGDQSIGVSASTSVLPMNTQDWSPLGWTGWISLQSKGLSRVLSNTTFQKHQFFSTQLSL